MKIIGHRGACGLAPENTIAGLQKALEHHVDELEFDLRVTKDSVVVLHHDAMLRDPDGKRHVIRDCTYQELRHHKKDLPILEEALETIGHPVPLYVEVKRGEPVEPVVRIIKKYLSKGWRPEYFLLGSKSQKILMELHRALPNIEKIVIEPWSGILATRRARQVNTTRISMNQLWLWGGFIKMMKRGGWQLGAYPLNSPKKAKRWARNGLASVVTDYPDRFER